MSILFWVIMLLWLVLGLWSTWPNIRAGVPNLILFLLLLILGWRVFGAPLQP